MTIVVQGLVFALVTILWLVFLMTTHEWRPIAELEWADIIFELFRCVFTVALIFLVNRFQEKSVPIKLMLAGFTLVLIGEIHDFSEEIYYQPFLVSLLFENVAYSLGIVLIAMGIFKLSDRHNRLLAKLQVEKSILHRKSTTDALTGAFNRTYFREFSSHLLQHNRTGIDSGKQQVSLAILDLDKFKAVNDTHGHDTGDEVLQCLAKLILSRLSPLETFIRLGGEEFLLLRQGDGKALVKLLNRAREDFSQLCIDCDQKLNLKCTFSAGVTVLRPGETLRDAMKRADLRLYEAKQRGRNQVISEGINFATVATEPKLAL
ncbi:MAG: hypothetical protein PsegKO_36140 [Pseudohongiellaceae bacterium]